MNNPEPARGAWVLVVLLIGLTAITAEPISVKGSEIIWLPSAGEVFPEQEVRSPRRSDREYIVRAPHEYSPRPETEEFSLVQRIVHPAERGRRFEDLDERIHRVRVGFSRPVAGTLVLETGHDGSSSGQEFARTAVDATDEVEVSLPEESLSGSLYDLSARLLLSTSVLEVFWEPAGLGSPLAIEFLINSTEVAGEELVLELEVPEPDQPEGRLTDLALEEHRRNVERSGEPLRIEFVSGIDSERRIDEIGYWLRPVSEIVPEDS